MTGEISFVHSLQAVNQICDIGPVDVELLIIKIQIALQLEMSQGITDL